MYRLVVIDIGATWIRTALVPPVDRKAAYRAAPKSYAATLACIQEQVNELQARGVPAYVCCPGLVDRDGSVRSALYSPVSGKHLRRDLEARLGVPVRVWNDAKAQAFGAYSSVKGTTAYITIGTAVGGAIINSGAVASGRNGYAGELGHIGVVDNQRQCPCGALGCADTLASGWSIERDLGKGWHHNSSGSSSERLFRAGRAIESVVQTTLAMLDPHLVAVNGRLTRYREFVRGLISTNSLWGARTTLLSDASWPFTLRWALKLAEFGGPE